LERAVDLFAVAGEVVRSAALLAAEEGGETGGFTINLFWVIVAAANFVFFFAVIWTFAFKPVSSMLESRQVKIEQGLRDAEAARLQLEHAGAEAAGEIAAARREAREIVEHSQRLAQETREADMAATRADLDRMRTRATAEIEAERVRAIADLRAEVAGLALEAASRVVGESMTGERQRRLVEEFLVEAGGREGAG
jgi:F-type H+-transporting ATPase subunit b